MSNEEEPIVDSSTQPEVKQPDKETNITPNPLIHRSNRVRLLPDLYGFHIAIEGDTLIGNHTLVGMDEPSNYKESMLGS